MSGMGTFHLPQFFILPEFFSNFLPTKSNIFDDLENFNNQSCLESFEKNNWNQVLQLNQDDVNITSENHLNTLNTLINLHAPLKKLNKKQRKFQQRPWIRNPKSN